MNQDLEKLVKAERKNKRELAELRAMLQKVQRQVNPDKKVIAMIEAEIARLLG